MAVYDQVLVEHVSFSFNTIALGSMIVCGLPASPHDPVHELDAWYVVTPTNSREDGHYVYNVTVRNVDDESPSAS